LTFTGFPVDVYRVSVDFPRTTPDRSGSSSVNRHNDESLCRPIWRFRPDAHTYRLLIVKDR